MLRTATQLAGGVASRVGHAIGFDEILNRSPPADPGDAATASESTASESPASESTGREREKLAATIRLELARHSIDVHQTLDLRVQEDGSLRVDSHHSRAAEIENLLNGSEQVLVAAGNLARQQRTNQISIDLTSSVEPENMVAPGGYPNW